MVDQLQKFKATKRAGDTLDYSFNFAPMRLGDDTITSANFDFSPKDGGQPVLVTYEIQGHAVVALISGGRAGTSYTVSCQATTTKGKEFTRSAILPVVA